MCGIVGNGILDSGALQLGRALAVNTSLTTLYLGGTCSRAPIHGVLSHRVGCKLCYARTSLPLCTWTHVRTDTCVHAAAHVCKRPGNHVSAKLGSSLARMVKYNAAVVVGSPAAH